MKRNLFLLFISSTLLFSCSSDDNTKKSTENEIVGSWRATEFKAADPTSSNVNFGAEILENLTAEGCYILTFKFDADLTVVAKNAANYLEINATSTGISVPCPEKSDTETSAYTYDGTTLTTVDAAGTKVSAKVTIDGKIMSVDASDLDVPNFDGEGQLIFEKY